MVEDDRAQARVIEAALSTEGWTVRHAGTVGEATEQVRGGTPDVALVDYELPDGTGRDVLDAMREEVPGTPAVVLTGEGDEEVALEMLSRGAARYLVKGEAGPGEIAASLEEVARMWGGITPLEATPQPREAAGSPDREPVGGGARERPGLEETVQRIVGGPVQGAGVYDRRGEVLAASFPAGIDPGDVGRPAREVSEGIAEAGEALGMDLHGQLVLATGDEATVGATMLPSPLAGVLVLVVDPDLDREEMVRRLFGATQQVWDAFDDGGSES